jgi:hypothetical protein
MKQDLMNDEIMNGDYLLIRKVIQSAGGIMKENAAQEVVMLMRVSV